MSVAQIDTKKLQHAIQTLEIALPAPGDALQQDEEWAVVRVGGQWRRIRLHDYNEVYDVPGLYEKWIYEVFQCKSPQMVRRLLQLALKKAGVSGEDLTVLDLGAGNGCVAEEFLHLGAARFVGVDIHPEAAMAADRDRPGLYDDFVIGDMVNLPPDGQATLDRYEFNCLSCVAALGFSDIPPAVFAAAYNNINNDGWIAFTIKTDFVDGSAPSGFSKLIDRLMLRDKLSLVTRETFTHRISTDGKPLMYDAFIGRKRDDVPEDWVG
jgi:SAM-dependent methyltransferase